MRPFVSIEQGNFPDAICWLDNFDSTMHVTLQLHHWVNNADNRFKSDWVCWIFDYDSFPFWLNTMRRVLFRRKAIYHTTEIWKLLSAPPKVRESLPWTALSTSRCTRFRTEREFIEACVWSPWKLSQQKGQSLAPHFHAESGWKNKPSN